MAGGALFGINPHDNLTNGFAEIRNVFVSKTNSDTDNTATTIPNTVWGLDN